MIIDGGGGISFRTPGAGAPTIWPKHLSISRLDLVCACLDYTKMHQWRQNQLDVVMKQENYRSQHKFDREIPLHGNHVLWHRRRRRCVGHSWTYSLPSPSWPFPPAPCATAGPPCCPRRPPSPRGGVPRPSGTSAASATSVDPLGGAPDPDSLSRRRRRHCGRRRGCPSPPCPCLVVHPPCLGRGPCLFSSSSPFCPVESRQYMNRCIFSRTESLPHLIPTLAPASVLGLLSGVVVVFARSPPLPLVPRGRRIPRVPMIPVVLAVFGAFRGAFPRVPVLLLLLLFLLFVGLALFFVLLFAIAAVSPSTSIAPPVAIAVVVAHGALQFPLPV